jgi:hypothetical protein
MPTLAQLEGLYRVSYYLTYLTLQPIHLVCIDKKTANLFDLGRKRRRHYHENYFRRRSLVMNPVDYTAMSDRELNSMFKFFVFGAWNYPC